MTDDATEPIAAADAIEPSSEPIEPASDQNDAAPDPTGPSSEPIEPPSDPRGSDSSFVSTGGSDDPSGAAPSLFDSPMAEITLTYETACARIEEIIRRLDSGEAGLRETLELCQEGRRLIEFCAGELDAVGRGLEELKLDELVARLEAGRAAA